MPKGAWKVVAILLSLISLASIFLVISMYFWPSIPAYPVPSEGRVYPLNNHGRYTYMNQGEYQFRSAAEFTFVLSFVGFCFIQQIVDPFDYERRGRY